MSTLREQIKQDSMIAMKARDRFTLNTLRAVLGEIQTQEKAGKAAKDFSDNQVQSLLAKEVKKRRETAAIYQSAGEVQRAETEIAEAELLSRYLPDMLSRDEIAALILTKVRETGVTEQEDRGRVIKAVMSEAAGRAEGKIVSEMVPQLIRAENERRIISASAPISDEALKYLDNL